MHLDSNGRPVAEVLACYEAIDETATAQDPKIRSLKAF